MKTSKPKAPETGFPKLLPNREGDGRWEQIIADPKPRPKLEAFMEASRAEGGEEPLDPERTDKLFG